MERSWTRMRCAALVAGALALIATAQAQAPVRSAAQEAVARAALGYASALEPGRKVGLVAAPGLVFNAPPQDIRATLDTAAASIAVERSRILTLAPPPLVAPGMDLNFIVPPLRAEANARLDDYAAAVAAAEAMVAAQSVSDCAAMEARERDVTRLRVRVLGAGRVTRALETFLGAYAGAAPTVVVPPPPRTAAQVEQKMFDSLLVQASQRLRCPLLAPDVSFTLDAQVARGGGITFTMPDTTPTDLKAFVLGRLKNVTASPESALNWGEVGVFQGATFPLAWGGQRLSRRGP